MADLKKVALPPPPTKKNVKFWKFETPPPRLFSGWLSRCDFWGDPPQKKVSSYPPP